MGLDGFSVFRFGLDSKVEFWSVSLFVSVLGFVEHRVRDRELNLVLGIGGMKLRLLSLVWGHGEAKVVEVDEPVALGMVEVAGKLTAFMVADVAAAQLMADAASTAKELINRLGEVFPCRITNQLQCDTLNEL